MLTDYFVHCPVSRLRLARLPVPARRPQGDARPATFAPRDQLLLQACSRVWQARIVHDDAVNLPTEPQAV